MIPQTSKISKRILWSSLNFSALGGRGKEKNQKPAAKNFVSQSEGEAEFFENAASIDMKTILCYTLS